ncbi:hypothetical protein HYR99_36205, partial [Candidatus Poribacteria bacterium]|nr:hypothetical protein [Candidatus Poribacteria bacterium]
EGTKIDLTSTVTDPSSADTTAGFTYAWSVTKNGNPFGSGTSAGFSFTPDDNATYAVTLNVKDKDNGTSPPDSKTITVTNVAPTASIGGAPTSSPEGTKIDLTSTVTDPSSVDTTAGFTYAWSVTKNGNPFGSGSSAGFNFTPDDNATYAVTLNVKDKDTGTGTDSKTITVTNVAPTASIMGAPASGPEGTKIDLTSTVTDPSSVDTAAGFTYVWSVTKNGNPFASGTNPTLSFTPDDNATYAVTLNVKDKDTGTGTDSKTITVTNVAPTVSISGAPTSSPEGTKIDLTSTVTDPSSADTTAGFTYAWSVTKNGNPFASGTNPTLSFTPDDNGTYAVTFSVKDKDNGTGTDNKTITVTNVVPTISSVTNTGPVTEGSPISVTFTITDPGADTWDYFVDWNNDGDFLDTDESVTGSTQKTVTLTHTYPDDFTASIPVKVADKDGGADTSKTTLITVNNVPPPSTA